VLPLLLALAGIAVIALGFLLLRTLGEAYRVARVLRAAPVASADEAAEAARRGERRYLRVRGRVESDEEFPDEHDRPLVFRRERYEVGPRAGSRGWTLLEERRLAVPFGVEERGRFVRVDIDALDEGLVVIPRESEGSARELQGLFPDLDPDAPVRHRVHQVSAVERAWVAGVPVVDAQGEPRLTAGLGRPLVVSTLEIDEAMRLLSAGHGRTVRLAATALATGAVLLFTAVIAALLGVIVR
jgi:hypothetical protein